MKDKEKLVQLAITAALIFATIEAPAAPTPTPQTDNMEKCYGIVRAGMNDCQTATASCAGSAKKDKQADAFIFLPKGTCTKIVDGSLTPKTDKK